INIQFDDGPHEYTRDLVEYMINHEDVKITFFTVGKFHYPYAEDVEAYQYAMKKAHDFGYQIASQTYTHKIPQDKMEFRKSLIENDNFIKKYTGDRPRFFRAPNGNCDEKCQSYLNEWGYRLVKWDVDSNDNDLETSRSIEHRIDDSILNLRKIFEEERNNYLIRLHDTLNYTVHEIVPWIIEKSGMKEKGYRFVTVAECIGDEKG
ncbi:carbohydrate esterase family 4 protein, partial [Piromyces sp. E2]